jgi:hypothetical protein
METLPSKFNSYKFTNEELNAIKSLPYTFRCYLENELTNTMLRKIAILYQPDAELDWKLLHAELDGKISFITELLNLDPVKPSVTKPKEQQ